MGSFSPTIANNPTTQGGGKGASFPAPTQQPTSQQPMQFQGKGGTTNPATSGQPQMGDPSQNPQSSQMFQPQRNFPNTIQQMDNTGNTGNTTNQPISAGKGKGA